MRLARLISALSLLFFASGADAAPIVAAVIAGEAITAAMVASAIFQSIIGFALSSIASSVFGKDSIPPPDSSMSFQSEAHGRLQVIRSSVATRQIAYGEFMRSGPLIYAETTGSNNEYLHMVVVVAPHEINSFEEIWLGDEKVGDLDSSGNVTTGRFAGWVRVKYHLGSPTQEADADLIAESAGNWTSAHKASGCAYFYLRLKWSQDVWPGGIPNAKVLLRGKSVEDPRTLTISFSTNWSSCVRDYILTDAFDGGLGCDDDEVNDTIFAASANTSDERVLMAAHTNDFTVDTSTNVLTLEDEEVIIASGDGVSISTTGKMPYTDGDDIAPSYLSLPGVLGNYISTPNSVSNDLTGSVDLRVRISLTSLAPATYGPLLSNLNAGNSRGYYFAQGNGSSGYLEAGWRNSAGTPFAAFSSVTLAAAGIPLSTKVWLRVTLDMSNGNANFYWSSAVAPGASDWTNIGTYAASGGAASNIGASGAVLGVNRFGNLAGWEAGQTGRIYRAQLYSGIAGTLVQDMDPRQAVDGAASFVATTGETWSVATSGGSPARLTKDESSTLYWIRTGPTSGKLASTYANALAKTAIDITGAGSGILALHHVDQARYTLSGAVDTDKKPKEILLSMLSAAAGILTYPQGQFAAYPAAYAAPSDTVGLSDFRGNLQVTPYIARRDLYNAVQGVYSNPANFWEPSSFPIVTNELYEQQDNGDRIVRDIELAYTNDSVRAQRIAKVHLEMSRQGMIATIPGKMTLFKYAIWDTFYLTIPQLGFDAKVFRVINWKLAEQGIGVDIIAREESAASYDWAMGDATVVDTAPNTNLQSARTVAVPGDPSITETKYETTGSAGVKSRATVVWAAAADAFVVGYDAQYRITGSGDTGWLSLSPVSLLVAQQDDLAPGSYDFRVRAINSLGVRSDWSSTVTKTLLGLTDAPASVSGFSVIKSGGIGIAQFALHADLDVRIGGRIVVRWSPLTTGATWNNSIIFEEYNGDAVSGIIPLRSGTYMAKAKDSTGHFSDTEVSFVATEGLVTGFTTVGTITEHAAFTGSKTNVALVSSAIQLDGLTLIDSSVTNIDDWPFIDSYGGISATGSYAFAGYFNFAASATRRLEASISASQFDTGDLVDSRTGDIDDWIDVDGASVQDCDVTLYCRTSDNDPGSPTPTWSAWSPFFVGDYTFKTAEFKLDFVSGSSNHNIAISELTVTAKIPA